MTVLLDFLALTKPRLAVLVIFTTAVGIALAPGSLSRAELLEAILWTTLVVAAGTTMNMAMEVEADRKMTRTRNRPLAAGRLPVKWAWCFGAALAALALPALFLRVNPLTAFLGLFALVVYLLVYTPLKSRSAAAVYAGAIPGATPILMGWTAATGSLDLPAVALFSILFLWQFTHFIAISLYRREEYRAAGFRILPLEYGDRASLWHMLGTTVGLVVASALPSYFELAGLWYLATCISLATFAILGTLYGIGAAANVVWARRYFLTTLVYLPVLLGVLVLDRI
jgi:protoheme IX farnesyltransferase